MSDFNTYEITVNVAMRVSAYDKEHAVNVAGEILAPVAGVMFVSGNDKNTELTESLNVEYERSLGIYEELEVLTFNSEYSEDYEDTVKRLYEQGYSDALSMVLSKLKENN